MRAKSFFRMFVPLLFLSLACSLAGGSVSPTPVVEERPTQSMEMQPSQEDAGFSVDKLKADYVYTSELITIIYPLYGSKLDDFVIVTLTNENVAPIKVLVESEISGYTEKATDTVTVEAGGTLEVRQNPRLIPNMIDNLNTEKPAQVHIRVAALVEGTEKVILDETGDTLIYARRDFPWSISGFTDEQVFELMAAMVTPSDPSVEKLIRQAANYTDSGIMWSGYGGHVHDDDGGVKQRLAAIWEAETRDYQLTYVSTWVSFAPGSVQRIRLPAETLEQNGGNCIELALLYASAAEALDLEAAIVGIPGHAFVAVRSDQENANYYFIETTLIGRSSFDQALNRASEEFDEALPHLDAKEDGYGWVTIWDARKDGITPLPWH
jgi:hypothetical protein